MTVITNHSDYLQKRLAGESVISIASLFGIGALRQLPILRNFDVLSLAGDTYSIYSYQVENGKFCVTDMHESVTCALNEQLPSALLNNQTTMRWWNCVFFAQNGKRLYDNAYDDLKFADNNSLCFKELLTTVKQELSQLTISKNATHILLTGDLAINPLIQYVVQMLFPSKQIVILQSEPNKDYEEKDFVIAPQKKLEKISLHTNQDITLSSLVSYPVHITLPLDSSIDSVILQNFTWKDMLTDDMKDYSVDNLNFKNVLLRVDYDAFSNIFITSEDIFGHRKVIQIN